MKARQQIDYLKHIASLMRRGHELTRFLKFIGVGLSGTVVNLGILALVSQMTTWTKYVAELPGIEISIITNFLLNDFFTFKDRRGNSKNKSFVNRLLKFNLVGLTGAAINIGLYSLILFLWGTDSTVIRLIAQAISIVVVFLWNYILSMVWTWK
jgi:dolichol-phosphate mannosyltransferase